MIAMTPIVSNDDRMELHQMRYVLAVAHARSFTRAAEACHVVQSALSQQISKLERELGVPLFSRSSRRVELTAAGAAFVPWARTTLDAVDRAAAEAVAADGVVSGPLRIGLIPTPSALDVPDFLRRLHRTYPQVTAQLRVGSSDRLISEVGEGNLDLALVGLADGTTPQRVEHRALAREALVAVLPVEHSAATGSSISRVLTLAGMAEEPCADFPAGRRIAEWGARNPRLAPAALADGTTPQRVEHRALAREALVAVLPVEHSAATGSSISRVLTLADMAEEPFADFPAGSPGRLQSDLAFRAAGLARDVRYEAATPGLIVDVVAAGLAVALLPQTFARGEGVTTRTVADGPHRTEYLVWDGFSPSAATRAALSLLDP